MQNVSEYQNRCIETATTLLYKYSSILKDLKQNKIFFYKYDYTYIVFDSFKKSKPINVIDKLQCLNKCSITNC
jgi:hypothetical protein